MAYFLFVVLGAVGGGFCVYVALDAARRKLATQKLTLDDYAIRVKEAWAKVDAREKAAEVQINEAWEKIRGMQNQVEVSAQELGNAKGQFEARVVSYDELANENVLVKRDLQNLDTHIRKLKLDYEVQAKAQNAIDERSTELATIYLRDNVRWIGSHLTPNNYANSKERLQKVIERCRSIGFQLSRVDEDQLFIDLKKEYELVVRAALEREEQARIRAQIREEQQREREIQRELQQLEREREAIAAALAKALSEAVDEHNVEVESLRARLAEAEARTQRAISQAQLTKAGHVYVISNIGSFGEGVYKIGMTRRLEPSDRILELSGAAVPFPFDVHMMISCDDAPSMENALHRRFHKTRINKTNPRKEFFRTSINEIVQIVREHKGEVAYVADAEALQYRQSLSMTEDDQEFIESLYEDEEDDIEGAAD